MLGGSGWQGAGDEGGTQEKGWETHFSLLRMVMHPFRFACAFRRRLDSRDFRRAVIRISVASWSAPVEIVLSDEFDFSFCFA